MNEMIKAGEVFKLGDVVNYQEGTVVNKFLVNNEHMKFVIKAFDAGTELPEHAAPGDVVVFALEGEGVIVYEGEEFTIKAGENFHFVKLQHSSRWQLLHHWDKRNGIRSTKLKRLKLISCFN